MRFDLTDLKLFLHVVEAGSITAGAIRTRDIAPVMFVPLRRP